MELELDNLTNNLDTYSSNFDGTDDYLEYLTLQGLYKLSKSTLLSIGSRFNLTNFSLPDEMGNNSLVIYSNGEIDGQIKPISIKIYLIHEDAITESEHVQRLVSDMEISPKIIYHQLVNFSSSEFKIKIVLAQKIIPYPSFKWKSIRQLKLATVSLIEKTLKFHSLGFVHNDLKHENFGMDLDGNVYLYDFDNYGTIKNYKCSLSLSSSVCHPPPGIRFDYINQKLGNRIIDLFSIVSIILGDFYKVRFWQFSNEEFPKKNRAIQNFNRGKVYYWIQHNLTFIFRGHSAEKSPFWYALTNFVHLIIKDFANRTHRSFFKRAMVLISRMKANI